jgi:hypothetical protein
MKCPSCESTMVEKKSYNGEMSCTDCGAEFATKFEKLNLYVPGTYEKLCESVVNHIANKVRDPRVISALKGSAKGFINEGSASVDNFIDSLTESADILYSQYLGGYNTKDYFVSYMEGITKLQAWKKINEAGFLGVSSMPAVTVDVPPTPGVEAGLPDHEQEENSAIDAAQTALDALNAAIGDMNAAQTNELGGVPVPCDYQGSGCGTDVAASPVAPAPVPPAVPLPLGGAPLAAAPVSPAPLATPGSSLNVAPIAEPLLDAPAPATSEVPAAPVEDEVSDVDARFQKDEDYVTTENYAFRKGDSVFVGNNETDKWNIFGIKGGKLYARLGEQTQILDPEDEDTNVRLAEDATIYAERVANSEDRMRTIWEAMEERINNAKSFVNNRGWEPIAEDTSVETAEGSDKPIEDGLGGTQTDLPVEQGSSPKKSAAPATKKSGKVDAAAGADAPVKDGLGGGVEEGDAKPEATPGDRHGEYTKKDETAEGADKPVEDAEGGKQTDEPKKVAESVIGDHFHNAVGEKRPFPFTQDPLNTNNDHFDPNELGDLEVKNRLAIAKGTGVSVDDAITPKKPGIGGDTTGTGSGGNAMGDSVNYLKVNDLIYVRENYKVQWEVTRVEGSHKAFLKSGGKSIMIDPTVDSFSHVDGVSMSWEREGARIADTKRLWESLEKEFEKDTKGLSPAGYVLNESVEPTVLTESEEKKVQIHKERPILEKAELYQRIKASGIHLEPRSKALQQLVAVYANPLVEMIEVFEDAIASERAGNEKIEDLYGGYQKPNDLETKFKLESAWKEMDDKIQEEAKAAEEAEKVEETETVEEGLTDKSDGKNAEKQLAIGAKGINARDKRGGFSINL